jgi:hypothetical protein
MSDVILGEILTGVNHRDAVHIAIAPVVAAEQLRAGQQVGFMNSGTMTVGPSKQPIGIVDPFLVGYVARGEQFWLFLFPNTITSLRHNWTHPAFPQETSVVCSHAVESEVWLREFAAEQGISYEYLMREIPTGSVCTGNTDVYGVDADEVLRHFKNVTGVEMGSIYFRCAC